MRLPRKGDPRRPLHLAIRSMRLLGGLLILFGTCATVPFVIRSGGGGVRATGFMIVFGAFYFVPGAAFIALSVFLDRRQFWAVVASICLAALALLFSLAVLVGTLYVAVASPFQAPMLIPLAVVVLVVLALAQLIYHLALSFEAIKHLPEEAHGFEPIMVRPPPPPAMYPQQHEQPRDEPREPPSSPAV